MFQAILLEVFLNLVFFIIILGMSDFEKTKAAYLTNTLEVLTYSRKYSI